MAHLPSHLKTLQARLARACTPDLLAPAYRAGWSPANPQYGFCSAASEALWFVLGGNEAGWHAHIARDHDGTTHWWLEHDDGTRLDTTVDQYRRVGRSPPYERGLEGFAGGFMGVRRDAESPGGSAGGPAAARQCFSNESWRRTVFRFRTPMPLHSGPRNGARARRVRFHAGGGALDLCFRTLRRRPDPGRLFLVGSAIGDPGCCLGFRPTVEVAHVRGSA